MDPQTYYAVQSRFTDPGRQADLLDDLPRDVAGLCRVVQGLALSTSQSGPRPGNAQQGGDDPVG
jgi:hypothetical protein